MSKARDLASGDNGVRPYAMAAGSVTVSLSGTSNGNTSVTFPASRFTATPMVSSNMSSAAGGTQKFVPRLISVSTSGATMYIYTGDSTTATASVNVNWIAVQITSSAGAG